MVGVVEREARDVKQLLQVSAGEAERPAPPGAVQLPFIPTRLGTPRGTEGKASLGASRVAAHETCTSGILRIARPSSLALAPHWWGKGRSSSGVAVCYEDRAATAAGSPASG